MRFLVNNLIIQRYSNRATQVEYAETLAGKTHTFAQQSVRYMRDYLNGSTADAKNHWTEIEVWGTAVTAYVGDYYEWNGGLQTMNKDGQACFDTPRDIWPTE